MISPNTVYVLQQFSLIFSFFIAGQKTVRQGGVLCFLRLLGFGWAVLLGFWLVFFFCSNISKAALIWFQLTGCLNRQIIKLYIKFKLEHFLLYLRYHLVSNYS